MWLLPYLRDTPTYDAVVARTVRYSLGALALGGVVLLTGGCGAASSSQPSPRQTARDTLSLKSQRARYLEIAGEANHTIGPLMNKLPSLMRTNIAGSDADMWAIAASERLFDRRLLRIHFSPDVEPIARQLYVANQSRASITADAADAVSFPELRHDRLRMLEANAPLEAAVRAIRKKLGLPPPNTS
jgi:hypothetical protein